MFRTSSNTVATGLVSHKFSILTNAASLPRKQLRAALRNFIHQDSHLWMRGLEVGGDPMRTQLLRSHRANRPYQNLRKGLAHALLQIHLSRDLQQMNDLDRSCEQGNIYLTARKSGGRLAQRRGVLRQPPFVNRNSRDLERRAR